MYRTRRQLAVVVAAACVAMVGAVATAERADGAASDSVAVTSTVGSVLSVADSCSAAISFSVTLSTYSSGSCAFQFGATNDATTTLRIDTAAGDLLSGAVFADHVGGCGALTGDSAGVKVSAVGAGVSGALGGCSVSAAASNADFVAAPDTPGAACTGTTIGAAANTCTLTVGVRETGGDATAGAYAGTIDIDVIG